MELDTIVENIANYRIKIQSISGIGTSIILPDLNIIFDIGILLPESSKIGRVLITHCHMDHIGAIGQHIAQRNLKNYGNTSYFIPNTETKNVKSLINNFRQLDGTELKCNILKMDEQLDLGKKYICTKFDTIHKVKSQGYIIWKSTTKLLPELKEKLDKNIITKDDIKIYKKNGEKIVYAELSPEIAYTGDTVIEGISDDAKNAKILIMEMTFVDEQISIDEARRRGHIHLLEFALYMDSFKNKNIILTHFSDRYNKSEIFWNIYRLVPSNILKKLYLGFDGKIYKFENPIIRFRGRDNPFGFLSNFYEAHFVINGNEWKTSEHYYQANKYIDQKNIEKIKNTKSPFDASYMANHKIPVEEIRSDWNEIKIKIMQTAIKNKFEQNEELLNKLLETHNIPLEEKTTVDKYWGTGDDNSGKNMLGKLLEELRTNLKK